YRKSASLPPSGCAPSRMDVAAVVGVRSLVTARVTGPWAASCHEHGTRAEHNASGSATVDLARTDIRRVPCCTLAAPLTAPRVQVLDVHGDGLMVVGRRAEVEALLREAGDLARQRGDPYMQRVCDSITQLFYTWDGRFDDALAVWERWDAAVADLSPADMANGWWWGEALARGGKGEYAQAL